MTDMLAYFFRHLRSGFTLLLLLLPFFHFPCPRAPDQGRCVSGLVYHGSSDTNMEGAQCYSSKNISAARSVKHLKSHVRNYLKKEIRSADLKRWQYLFRLPTEDIMTFFYSYFFRMNLFFEKRRFDKFCKV